MLRVTTKMKTMKLRSKIWKKILKTMKKAEFSERQNYSVALPGTRKSIKVFKSPATLKQIAVGKKKNKMKKEVHFPETCWQAISKMSSGSSSAATMQQVVDEFDALGISWAAKFQKLNDVQNILAEDLINQTLKEVYFEELIRNTIIQDIHGSVVTSPMTFQVHPSFCRSYHKIGQTMH